ncbi:MAG: TPM domain-containing protein [Pseudomonadota bacterium]|nr:methanol dehydrogenase [Pseudomonadales bacterium]MDY6921468.1 TPM domain-containing protein [Pseudomonadota bacterium]
MLRLALFLPLFLVGLANLQAAPSFPKLSGQVVDTANLLSGAVEQRISAQLKAHENATGNQVVVVTLPQLQGYDIADYGYQLGRHWGIGQQEKDNGVLLIVAKAERKLRIEVGYGLEGKLTDAIANNIIQTVIRPAFKRGQFEQGIEAGATAIVAALGGQYKMRESRERRNSPAWIPLIIFIIIIVINTLGGGMRRLGGGRRYGSYYGGGFGGGSFGGGGGFSGGGGSFGGGGASGGW